MRFARLTALACATAGACSFDQGGGSGSGDSSSSTDGSTSTATTMATTATTLADTSTQGESTTVAPETSSGEPGSSSETGPTEELEHGFITLQLERTDGEPAGLFDGTVGIVVTMGYEQCIFDFYVAHPEYAQTGNMGPEIFGPLDGGGEGWFERLCDVPIANPIDCSVTAFEQQLEGIPALRIHYTVAGDIEGALLPFGPLPTLALAACGGGALPTVRLSSGGLVNGTDGTGQKIWEGEMFEPNSAATGDEAPIVVQAVVAG